MTLQVLIVEFLQTVCILEVRAAMEKSKVQAVLYATTLTISTIILLGVYITSGLAGSPDASKFGFKNTTGQISDLFYTQVSNIDVYFLYAERIN